MSAEQASLRRIELHENLYGDGLVAAESGLSERNVIWDINLANNKGGGMTD